MTLVTLTVQVPGAPVRFSTRETLDAPARGVDYTLPFGRVASIVLPDGGDRAQVTLWSGEALRLARAGDLGEGNAGLLVFTGSAAPEYLSWAEVERIDFERPPSAPSTPPASSER